MKLTSDDWSNFPPFVVKEMEKLESVIQPYIIKAARYSFWSLPLIFLSFFNLFFLLVILPERNNTAIVLYGLIGAIGFALSKEAKHYQNEVIKRSSTYMIDRIKASEIVPSAIKDKYTNLIQEHSSRSYRFFIAFLEEEHRLRRTFYF